MENKDTVSIIVPIYNKDKYLDDCVNSIVKQTYKNLEIILVDDGSTDLSADICEKWEQKDKRIHTYHIPNGGVGNARNYGMNVASGSEIMFIDADDMIKENCVEHMLAAYLENRVSLVTCGFTVFNSYSQETKRLQLGPKGKKEIRTYIEEMSVFDLHYYYNGPVAKLFSNSLATGNNLRFEGKDTYGEDFVFNMKLLSKTESVYTIDEPLYMYRIDSVGSLSKGVKPTTYLFQRLMLMIQLFEELIESKECNSEAKRNVVRFKNKIVKLIYSNIFLEYCSNGFIETRNKMKSYRNSFPDEEFFHIQKDIDKRIKFSVFCVKYKLYSLLFFGLRISKL